MLGKPLFALTALAAAGCVPTRRAELDLSANEVAVGAILERGHGQGLLITSTTSIPLSFGDETEMVLWRARTSDFLHEDRAPITPAELAGVRVRIGDQAADGAYGRCQRCIGGATGRPQAVFSGDSCEPPPFLAEDLIVIRRENGDVVTEQGDAIGPDDRMRAEEVRKAIRMDWPGPCACEDVDLAHRSEVTYDFDPADPSLDAWPFERWAVHPDGTVGGFSERRFVVIDPSGARRDYHVPASLRENLGPVLTAVAITYRGRPAFVIAASSLGLVEEQDYYLLVETSPEISVTLVDPRAPEFRPYRFKSIDSSSFWMLGGLEDHTFRAQHGAFYECRITDIDLSCTLAGQIASDCSTDKQQINDLEMIDDRRLAGTLKENGLLVGTRDGPNGTWQLGCVDNVTFVTHGTPYPIDFATLGGAAAFPNGRVFACVIADGNRALLTADFAGASSLEAMTDDVTWTLALDLPGRFGVPCEDFVPGPGPDQATIVTSLQAVGVCNRDGTCTSSAASDFTGIPAPMSLSRPVEGWTLATFFGASLLSQATQVWRRPDGGAFERILGPERFDPTPATPLFLGHDGAARRIDAGAIIRLKRTPEGRVETSTIVLPDFHDYVYDAAPDHTDGSFVLISTAYDATAQGYTPLIYRAWEDPPRVELIDQLPPARGPGCETTTLGRIVEAAPGEHIATNPCGAVVRITHDSVETLEPIWDDFETPELEVRPETIALVSLTASHGVVWIGGSAGLLLRVFGSEARRFSLAREPSDEGYRLGWTNGPVSGLRAFCPDRLLFGSGPQYYRTVPPVAQYQLEVAPLPPLAATAVALRSLFRREPHAILGAADRYVILTEGAWALQYERTPLRSLIVPFDTVEDREGILWLGGTDRRLVLAHPRQ